MATEKNSSITPRIIIHGGAGNITHENLPDKPYNTYLGALLTILNDANYRLRLPNATALDVATFAVTQLENNGLFNSGHGAVYTTEGKHELEASVMMSRGYRKRGVGVMGVKKVKNPILLAREMLIKGEEDDGGGAQGHCQLHGESCDRLAKEWGLDLVTPSYFWTRRRWDEHRRGMGLGHDEETYRKEKRRADAEAGFAEEDVSDTDVDAAEWDGKEYLPQGTVGAVVMDGTGTICVATSTGGITNKLPGRIGDTPTIGAGFWAEEWTESKKTAGDEFKRPRSSDMGDNSWLSSCLDRFSDALDSFAGPSPWPTSSEIVKNRRAVAMSGTGNGDSFLRVNAVRTAAAMARYSSSEDSTASLQQSVSRVAGPHGLLQQSAEDRWHKTGEGEGGIIGLELDGAQGKVVFDYNCGGMFHAWIDDDGKAKFQVFKERVDG